ncbi:MAG: tripartite tricarboxylate transporter substrate binding protein, partial [Burkholderiales bacterium]
MQRITVASKFLGFVLLAASCVAHAQGAADSYPTKAIRIIIPFPPGGTSDIIGRLISVKLTERWGQQIIIESRA